jgi:hypothetical protein
VVFELHILTCISLITEHIENVIKLDDISILSNNRRILFTSIIFMFWTILQICYYLSCAYVGIVKSN